MKRLAICAALMSMLVVPNVAAASADAAAAHASVIAVRPPVEQTVISWVTDIDSSNLRQACDLQVQPEATGAPCSALPESIPVNCPRIDVGQTSPKALRPNQLRKPEEQVVEGWFEDPEHAVVSIRSQVIKSKYRGVVGAQLIGGTWKIAYARQGAELFAPATDVFQSPAYRKLWYPGSCFSPAS
jgi:hypothetical protein